MNAFRRLTVLLVAALVPTSCTFVQVLERPALEDASTPLPVPPDASSDTFSETRDGSRSTCPVEASGIAQDTPLDAVLVLAWERVDGQFMIERTRTTFAVDRRSFTVSTGTSAPPSDGRVSASAPWFAIGHVYAVSPSSTVDGLVDGMTFRQAMMAGTYRDAIVWVDRSRPEDAGAFWFNRAEPGYSVWACSDMRTKSEAFVESTCDGLRLESAGDPTGDRHCDWH